MLMDVSNRCFIIRRGMNIERLLIIVMGRYRCLLCSYGFVLGVCAYYHSVSKASFSPNVITVHDLKRFMFLIIYII